MKGDKVSTCLYIDREVLETAKEMGLNLSRVAENALIGAMEKLNGTETGKIPKTAQSTWCGGWDLNPRTPAG